MIITRKAILRRTILRGAGGGGGRAPAAVGAMIITRKASPRRPALRGVGAAVDLPLPRWES